MGFGRSSWWAALAVLLVASLPTVLLAQTQNASSFSISMKPSPQDLVLGFGFQLHEGMATCFRNDANGVFSAIPQVSTFFYSRCGGINFTATQVNTVVTSNGTTMETSESHSIYVEVVLLDPSQYIDGNITELLTNASMLRAAAANFTDWVDGMPPVNPAGARWEDVRRFYYAKQFSGPFAATNALQPSSRFMSTTGFNDAFLVPTGSALPIQMVGFLPVLETIAGATEFNVSSVAVESSTFFFASTPHNLSGVEDLTSELQVEVLPRVAMRVNYSGTVYRFDAATDPSAVGVAFDIVHAPRSPIDDRRMFRTDSDWDPSTAAIGPGNVKVVPPLMSVGLRSMQEVQFDSLQLAHGDANDVGNTSNTTIWWRSPAAVPSVTQRNVTLNVDFPLRTRSMRCFGVAWAPIYAQPARLAAMFLPSMMANGTVRTSSSGTYAGDHPCVPATSGALGSHNTTWVQLELCPNLGTQLLRGYHLCAVVDNDTVPQAFNFLPVLSPMDVSTDLPTGTAVSGGSMFGASAASMQTNTTQLLAAFAEAADGNGVVGSGTAAVPNATLLFRPSSSMRWAPIDRTVNLSVAACFAPTALLVVPMRNNSVPTTTLRPFGSATALSVFHIVDALRSAYRTLSIICTASLLIQADADNGYCGTPWREGLVARLWVDGLVVGFHNVPFRTRSTAYAMRSVNVSIVGATPRCCTTDYGTSLKTTCTTSTTTTTTTTCTVASCTPSTQQVTATAPRSSIQEDRVAKQPNVTIAAVALRCSYDVHGVQRNCTAAVGAFVQLVLLPSTPVGDAYLANHTLLHAYADRTPGSVSLTGLPLQLTNGSGVAVFSAAGPSMCFQETVRLAAVFPIRGASDGTSVISDGAVTSYYKGITSFAYASSLYMRVRPTPGLCGAGVRTIFMGGVLGAPLGALDTDIQDSCGTLLSGLVSMRLVSSGGSSVTTASTVGLSQAPLTTTLGGVLERRTNQLVNDPSQWRATFVGIVPTANASRLVLPAVRLSMRMQSASLAAIGDVVLSTDVQAIPYLADRLLNSCAMAAASGWVVVPNATADALAPLLAEDCGSARLDLLLSSPVGQPITIEVELYTSPTLLDTSDFALRGAWLNITFSVNNLNAAISAPTAYGNHIFFSSNLDQRRAPRAFMYAVQEGAIVFHNVEIRERMVPDLSAASASASSQVSTVAYVLPIFVKSRSLFNNLVREEVTVSWSPELFVASATAADGVLPSTAFTFSQSSLTFAIYPNARSLTSEAVMWLNFLTMSGNVVRVGNIVALRAAMSKCYSDSGDRLDLALHPLSFGVGSDDTTQYLVGGVVGNVAVIAAAFVMHAVKEHVVFRGNTEFNRKGAIDMEDPDASKGLRTFPGWGLVMCAMLYPGLMYSGVRAVSLGLSTVLLYTIMLMLVLFGIGYLALLVVAQRYYTPRWQDNEAFNKDVAQSVAAGGGGNRATRRSAKARLDAARESAKTAVSDTQHAVGGFFAKTLTPTGFYEVNHTDHIRFLVAYQDYRGKASYAVAIDVAFGLLYAITSAFDCPTNQTAALVACGAHILFLLAYRPYVTVARVLCNVMINAGCLVAIAITIRGRESEGIQTLDAVMMAMSGFNLLGFVWTFWRSEGLRRMVRQRRRLSRKADHFSGRGRHFQSPLTGLLKAIELHLYGLHSVKPQVVHRRMIRRRRLLHEDANVVIESSSGSPTDDESHSSETPNLKSLAAAMASAAAGAPSQPAVTIRETSPGDDQEMLTIRSNDGAASSGSMRGIPPILNLHSSMAMSQRSQGGGGSLVSPTNRRTTSSVFRSTVSDDDDEDNDGDDHDISIHADSPDAMNAASVARRKFAANRFKAYIKTETGKSFGRSDADSVVKRLVVTEDGVREVREWREGTVQMANEEIRRRQTMEEEFKNLSSTIHRQSRPSTTRWSRRVDRDQVETEGQLRRWEDAFRYEIARSHGIDTVRADNGTAGHETLLQRRQRVMGAQTPASFDFDRGVDGS